MTERPAGLIDTNILIHALTHDAQGLDCRAFLEQVQLGRQQVVLTTLVVFEFTYAVARYVKQMSRRDIGEYLIGLMALPAVRVDDDLLSESIRIWMQSGNLGFVDAYLAVRAERERIPIYTKNLRDFQNFDVETPDPLMAKR